MTNSIKLVTGHESDASATAEYTDRSRAEWAALTDTERDERIAKGHVEFDAACAAIGHVPFWA
jgi:hypothetical protein